VTPLRVLIVTDSFPPGCGGSGWSTWELATGLQARGHAVHVIKIEIGRPAGVQDIAVEGLPVTIFRQPAPSTPALRNVSKNERLWRQLGRYLATRLARAPVDIVHAQHVMSTVPSIRAGTVAGVPVIATVRDYWPVCYWSDLIYDPGQPRLCDACTPGMMTRCIRPRAGGAWPLALPLIPYMRANLATKRTTLARASAVIAVSSAIARDLRARAPGLRPDLVHQIPNPFDMKAIEHVETSAASSPLEGPYVLYAGKLATNKGVQFLPDALARAGITWPVVVVGDGPLRSTLETEARQHGLHLRVVGWQPRDEVWRWMRHAAIVAFPSYGPESLSRVLIEAAALGAPIAAMDTGGTRDILTAGATGLLSEDVAGFSRDLARLAGDAALRTEIAAAARRDVRARFAAPLVVERIEQVYRAVIDARTSVAGA
jgi:glycosyltransferase involved in cell wall biosynthesis